MFQRTYSALLSGLSGIITEVECFIGNGLPYFNIVGIPSNSAAFARERIRSALKSCGYPLPPSRITVNIRPLTAGTSLLTSTFSSLDLPIALTILACQGQLPASALQNALFLGELSLNGEIKPLTGALALAHCALHAHIDRLYLPLSSASEAALSKHSSLFGLSDLIQTLSVLRGHTPAPPLPPAEPETASVTPTFDAIHGQDVAKRALMIAAAGMHNILLIGPPGCGKTLLAHSLTGLLPALTLPEKIELTEIYSACHLLSNGCSLISQPPFRSPHHTIPTSSLIGGGTIPHPGEITLAHHGILYLDELPEFSRTSLESLRQPLEEHQITLNRLQASFSFPADFLLVASMNPCPCGYYPDTARCRCPAARIHQYFNKINTPLLDRIDLVLVLSPVPFAHLKQTPSLSHAQATAHIQAARFAQSKRFLSESCYNSRMDLSAIRQFCSLSPHLEAFMQKAYAHYQLTLRSYHKILRVSRTLADLEGCKQIEERHLTEALQYRLNINEVLP